MLQPFLRGLSLPATIGSTLALNAGAGDSFGGSRIFSVSVMSIDYDYVDSSLKKYVFPEEMAKDILDGASTPLISLTNPLVQSFRQFHADKLRWMYKP